MNWLAGWLAGRQAGAQARLFFLSLPCACGWWGFRTVAVFGSGMGVIGAWVSGLVI